jgi:hypothetical protein
MKCNAWMLCNLAAVICMGCSPEEELATAPLARAEQTDNGLTINGLSSNGVSSNGLSRNGLSRNGLSRNGLSRNGLSAAEFHDWFARQAEGIAYSDMVMRYVVKCAAPAGTSISATIDGLTYVWPGGLGLAQEWVAGSSISPVEEQLVSACLAAHVNKFGVHVAISVLGNTSSGAPIPRTNRELTDYPIKEGCFFGNVFTDEGVFVGNDSVWTGDKSSVRDCAITVSGQPNDNCPPMIFAGQCNRICIPDAAKLSYTSCTFGGRTYAPLNTRIARGDIYQCGDHVCQISESCGNGNSPRNCRDCGPCL